jgi:excisionase family DNA binding protein
MNFNLLTVRDAARILGVTRIGVQKMIERGTLVPAGKVGNQHIFRPADVNRLAHKRGVEPATKTA